MTIWIDAQLSPAIATWITATFDVTAVAVRNLGLHESEDASIFQAARISNAVVMTKDRDFVDLQNRLGSPPDVIWITCGNTSNARLQEILIRTLPDVIAQLDSGKHLVEITDEL